MSFEPREFLRHILVETDYLWRAMAGMRDRLIHYHFGVDLDLDWDVPQRKIPVLRTQIQQILGTA